MKARVRIILDEGGDGNGCTWITTVPVRGNNSLATGVVMAAAEACALFSQNIMREAETVVERILRVDE